MPAYDFRCRECGHEFEVVRPVGRAAEECCPVCGGDTKRVFSPVGVVFKGSGFHNTDYRSKPAESGSSPADTPATESCPASGSSSSCSSCPASAEKKS